MLKSWNGGCHLIENGAGVPTAANDPVGVTSGRGEGDRRSGRFLDIARESRQIKLPPRDSPRDPHNRPNRCGLCRDALPRPCAPVTLQIVGLFPLPHPVHDRVVAVVLTGMGCDGFEGTSGGHGRHSDRLDRSAVATSFFVESGTGTRTSWKLAATGGTGTRTSWKLAATGGAPVVPNTTAFVPVPRRMAHGESPKANASVESFRGRIRDTCRKHHRFLSLDEDAGIIHDGGPHPTRLCTPDFFHHERQHQPIS